jgi:hypothetical protein
MLVPPLVGELLTVRYDTTGASYVNPLNRVPTTAETVTAPEAFAPIAELTPAAPLRHLIAE